MEDKWFYRIGYTILGLGGMGLGGALTYISLSGGTTGLLGVVIPILGISVAIACLVGLVAGWGTTIDKGDK